MAKKQTKTKATKKQATKRATPVIRVAAVANEKTGNDVLVRTRTDGVITDKRLRERLGVEQVEQWREVPASSWAEATTGFKKGKGTLVKANGTTAAKAKDAGDVECPHCGAGAGEACRTKAGKPATSMHAARSKATK